MDVMCEQSTYNYVEPFEPPKPTQYILLTSISVVHLGAAVGEVVGGAVGEAVTVSLDSGGVGAFVGEAVGASVGEAVGPGVGPAVGPGVGPAVGPGVMRGAGSLFDSVKPGVGAGVSSSLDSSDSSNSQQLSRHFLMHMSCSELDRPSSRQSPSANGPSSLLHSLKHACSSSRSHLRSGRSGMSMSSLSFSQHLARQDLVQGSLGSWQSFFLRQVLTQACSVEVSQ